MINKMKIILVAVIIIFGVSGISFAMSCDMDGHNDSCQASAQGAEKEAKAVDVGNKVCPVAGETIQEDTKATYEFNGKIYNFCCAMCIPEFKQDPEKYIKKIAEEKL